MVWSVPAPGLTFRAGAATLDFDPMGRLRSAVPDARPDLSYLTDGGQVEVVTAGGVLAPSPVQLTVDADELEVSRQHGDRLTSVVRHGFSSVWSVRVALTNLTDAPLVLDAVSLGWVAPATLPVWTLAAGAVGAYAVSAPDGDGPVLGGTLALGELVDVTPDTLEVGPVRLAPGGRFVVQWQWDWFAHLRAFAHRPGGGRDRQVPRTLTLFTGQAASISAGADEALVLDPGLIAETVRDQTELVAHDPGRYRVELRSARGSTRYELSYAEPVADLLVAAAESVLAGARTPAGVVRLDDLYAAQVVQFALQVGVDDPEAAEDALDLFTARLPDPADLDPAAASYLCGEFDRTGDPDLVQTATSIVQAAVAVLPGLGLAAGQVVVARWAAGLPPLDLVGQLTALVAQQPDPAPTRPAQAVAALETASLTRAGRSPASLLTQADALGRWLGGGLAGAPLRPWPVTEVAHLAAVLAGLDEGLSGGLRQRWAASGHELGQWAEATVVARLAGSPVGPAHAWLAAAARTR